MHTAINRLQFLAAPAVGEPVEYPWSTPSSTPGVPHRLPWSTPPITQEYPIEYPMRTLEYSIGCPLRRTPSIHRVSTPGTRERTARPRVRREYPIGRVYCEYLQTAAVLGLVGTHCAPDSREPNVWRCSRGERSTTAARLAAHTPSSPPAPVLLEYSRVL
jgi:hypothetical protein